MVMELDLKQWALYQGWWGAVRVAKNMKNKCPQE